MATRIDGRDFKKIAEFVKEEADSRKNARKDREKKWEEVDAQLEMDESQAYKLRSKRTDDGDWIPAFVLPHQSTALEVLTADARRMLLPESANWFECHANMTDDVLQKLESAPLIEAKRGEGYVGDQVDQESLDAICEAVLQHNHRKYDVGRTVDLLNADAMKYGEFAGRVREVKGTTFSEDYRGIYKEEKRFIGMSHSPMKMTYPDESCYQVLGEGMQIQPSWVRCWKQRIADIKLAAGKGSTDPENMATGGWLKKNVSSLEPESKTKTDIEVIEFEGDLVVSRSRDDIRLYNKIITVACGKEPKVIRYREQPMRSYVHGVYHYEGKDQKVGPLLKAAPLHNAMSEVFNRLVACAVLHVEPPVSFSPDDRFFLSEGGLRVEPRAAWASSGVQVHQIGDPQKLLEVFLMMARMYEELTGVTAPRTGAQTKSHQTAFAVDQEISRGQVRTIDYVKSVLRGPWLNWLNMEWELLRKTMKTESVYVPKLGGYIRISGSQLPDCTFEVHGAAGPLEEAQEMQKRAQSMMMALNLEQFSQQMGGKPMNVDEVRRVILQDGGWSDPERFFAQQVPGGANPAGAGVLEGIVPGLAMGGNSQ